MIRQRIEQAIGKAALAGDYSGIHSPANYTRAMRHTLTYNTLNVLQAMEPGEEVDIWVSYQLESRYPSTSLLLWTACHKGLAVSGYGPRQHP